MTYAPDVNTPVITSSGRKGRFVNAAERNGRLWWQLLYTTGKKVWVLANNCKADASLDATCQEETVPVLVRKTNTKETGMVVGVKKDNYQVIRISTTLEMPEKVIEHWLKKSCKPVTWQNAYPSDRFFMIPWKDWEFTGPRHLDRIADALALKHQIEAGLKPIRCRNTGRVFWPSSVECRWMLKIEFVRTNKSAVLAFFKDTRLHLCWPSGTNKGELIIICPHNVMNEPAQVTNNKTLAGYVTRIVPVPIQSTLSTF